MKERVNYRHSISKIVLTVLVMLPMLVRAQSTKEVIARLESTYKTGAGVEVQFALPDKSKVTMTLATDSNAYHLTSATEEFICDGKTQWHLFKKEKKVVVDKAGSTGANSQAMLDFAHNYDAKLTNPSKGNYTLTLTPHPNVASLFKSIGDVKTVEFKMVAKGGGLVVDSISAQAPNASMTLAKLKITPKKTLPKNLFTYKPARNIQVVDMRD